MASLPKYYQLAVADLGVKEAPGDADNPVVIQYFKDAHLPFRHDSISWCAAAMCAWLERSGIKSPRSGLARSFENWGVPVKKPEKGDIAVLWRGSPKASTGHVAFYEGYDPDNDRVLLLGGNQSDSVCRAWFPRKQVLTYRRPAPEAVEPKEIAPPPAPVPHEEVNEKIDDLRENGSRIVKGTDRIDAVVKHGVGALSVFGALKWVSEQVVTVSSVLDPIKPVVSWVWDHGWIALAVIAVVILIEAARIRFARGEDEATGKTKSLEPSVSASA